MGDDEQNKSKAIRIKRIYVKEGTKDGSKYTWVKILAGDGNYYTAFNKTIVMQLRAKKQGDSFTIAYSTDQEGHHNIVGIDANPGPNEEEDVSHPTSSSAGDPLPLSMIKATVESNLADADSMVRARYNLSKDAVLSDGQLKLVAEQSHQLHALFYLRQEQIFKMQNAKDRREKG